MIINKFLTKSYISQYLIFTNTYNNFKSNHSTMKKTGLIVLTTLLVAGLALPIANACTNFLVTKGASKDGSTMITYSADSHVLYGELYYWPERDWEPGTMLDVYEWDTG